jgi:hypothetical protein
MRAEGIAIHLWRPVRLTQAQILSEKSQGILKILVLIGLHGILLTYHQKQLVPYLSGYNSLKAIPAIGRQAVPWLVPIAFGIGTLDLCSFYV